MKKPNHFSIAPRNHNKKISAAANILYADLLGCCSQTGEVIVNYNDYSLFYGKTKTCVTDWFTELEKEGLIKQKPIPTQEEIVSLLAKKNLIGFGIGSRICEWCEVTTMILHKHHYPIQKKDGGKKTVDICPNCHHEFHCFNQDKIYQITSDLTELNNFKKNLLNGQPKGL